MTAPLLALLLAAPGTIRAEVLGGATEVVALEGDVVRARAAVEAGRAVLDGLPPGTYDVLARGPGVQSEPERGVRPSDGEGADVRLEARPVHRLELRTEPGALARVDGIAYPAGDVPVAAGLHRLLVEHAERAPAPPRFVRVTGPLALDAPLDPGLVVLGVVLDRAGAPVAGARVEAWVDGRPAGRAAEAAADGTFGLAGFRGEVVSLRVRALGYAEALRRVPFHGPDERVRVEVHLDPGSGVALRVLAPGPGAEAVLLPLWYERVLEEPRLLAGFSPPRRRAAAGVRFEGLRPGDEYRILVTAPGCRPRSTAAFRAPPAGEAVTLPPLALGRGHRIVGRALAWPDPFGHVVVCEGPEGRATCRTDRLGRFAFDGLDPGEHFLSIHEADERGVPVPLPDMAEGPVTRTIDLGPRDPGPALAVRGTVVDHDGKPLAGVIARGAGRSAASDDAGAFAIEGLPPGRAAFDVRLEPGPGCRGLVEDPHLPRTERAVPGEVLRARLDRASTLRLSFDTSGRPLCRARLVVAAPSGERRVLHLPRGAEGAVVEDVPQGTCRVDVLAPGFLGAGGAAAKTGEETRVVVGRGRTASGRVVLRRGALPPTGPLREHDAPLARGWVSLFDPALPRSPAVAPVEPDGSFRLPGLPSGRVLLCAASPGLPAALFEADLLAGDAAGLVLPLHEGVEAAVRVLGTDGPLPDARVHVFAAQGPDVRDVAALGRFRGVVADDEDLADVAPSFALLRTPDGRVSAPFVAPGSYRFVVAAEGHGTARVLVRAWTPWGLEEIRRLPDVPADLATPVRLARAEKD
jgi:hypothetical protein